MRRNLSKMLLLSAFAFLSTASFSQSAQLLMHRSGATASVNGMSPNGKWAVGSNGSDPNGAAYGFLWNLETDQITFLYDVENSDLNFAGGTDVSNDGMVVGSFENVPAIYKDGQWTKLPIPEGYDAGNASAVSGDGTIIAGHILVSKEGMGGKVVACKWVNEEFVLLNVPEKDSRGVAAIANMPSAISADGKVILGCLNWVFPESCSPIIWNPEPEIICNDIYYNAEGERNYTSIYETINISTNGKLVAGYVDYDGGGDFNSDATFLYNIETKETTVYLEGTAYGLAVDNNGVIYEGTDDNGPIRTAYIRIDGKQTLLNDYLKENYNFDISTTDFADLGTTVAISEDNKTLIGTEGPGGNWCLKLSNAPATSSINSQNSDKVTVSVNGKVMHINGNAQHITLTDLTGKIVINEQVSGNNVNLSNINNGVYVATLHVNGQNIIQKIMIK